MIFADYKMRRETLLGLMAEGQISGLWNDTLFPALKHMIEYGANNLSNDTLDGWIDAAFDAAMMTLGGLAPELAPGMVAFRKVTQ
jgi:hypothetical protein